MNCTSWTQHSLRVLLNFSEKSFHMNLRNHNYTYYDMCREVISEPQNFTIPWAIITAIITTMVPNSNSPVCSGRDRVGLSIGWARREGDFAIDPKIFITVWIAMIELTHSRTLVQKGGRRRFLRNRVATANQTCKLKQERFTASGNFFVTREPLDLETLNFTWISIPT